MRVLSLDPGYTTGIAVYDEEGKLEMSITATKETVYKNGFLNKLVNISQPEVVLVENVPRVADKETTRLFNHLEIWFRVAGFNLHIIQPGQWKGLAERVEIPGQHARDAATMAKWWIGSNGQRQRT